MAKTKKPRRKSYRPGKVTSASPLLLALPLADETVQRIMTKARQRLVRMRLSVKTVYDLLAVTVTYGCAWLAAERTEQTEELRLLFDEVVRMMAEECRTEGPLSPEAYQTAMERLELVEQLIRCLTTNEYLAYVKMVRDEKVYPLADDTLNAIEEAGNEGRLPEGSVEGLMIPED